MVKVSARQVRSMRRDLYKTKHETKRIRKKAETTTVKLDIEKQTNSILRSSLKNFSGPFYKLKHRYNKLVRAYTQKKTENDHLKRGIVQLNILRKRRAGKKRCINI